MLYNGGGEGEFGKSGSCLKKKQKKNMLTCGACRLHSTRLFASVQMHLAEMC